MYPYYIIRERYPNVKEITFRVIEVYGNKERIGKKSSLSPESSTNFFEKCPMSKCIGTNTGIYYKSVIDDMVMRKETKRQVKLPCSGYGGYNKVFRCEWYITYNIEITYL